MASYLITGSNRGLGLELVTQLSKQPASQIAVVFATGRKSSAELEEVIKASTGRVVFVVLDSTDKTSIASAVEQVTEAVGNKGLDVLINNAGVMVGKFADSVEKMENLTFHYEVNVLGVHHVTQGFLPLLRAGTQKKIVNISTTLGSIGLVDRYGLSQPAYKITKGALNMLTVQWSMVLKDEGFTVFPISPGWLKTDLGSEYADLPVDVGAKEVLAIIAAATPAATRRYRNIHVEGWENGNPSGGPGARNNIYNGEDPPW